MTSSPSHSNDRIYCTNIFAEVNLDHLFNWTLRNFYNDQRTLLISQDVSQAFFNSVASYTLELESCREVPTVIRIIKSFARNLRHSEQLLSETSFHESFRSTFTRGAIR